LPSWPKWRRQNHYHHLFLGFTAATSGSASINGVEVVPNDTATKKHIAYIPEVVMLYGNLTGVENLHFLQQTGGVQLL
jgi:ABC-2 type transport system ATP-binding protein